MGGGLLLIEVFGGPRWLDSGSVFWLFLSFLFRSNFYRESPVEANIPSSPW